MNVFTRFWNYLTALLNGKMDQLEDPEIIINQAVKDMRESQARNRELAVQAITQKNNLQAEVDKSERLVADFERKAMMALQAGNRDLAKTFLKEKALQEQTLNAMRTNLASAMEAADKVKLAIKSEEERIRVRTAEALSMKANMKQAQIQIKINKALDGMQFGDNEQSWASVQERIQSMQSEATARAEIVNSSVDSKLREIEVSAMDVEADRQLAELETKLTLGSNPATKYTTASNNLQQTQTVGAGGAAGNGAANGSAPESDIDRQLRELEAKLGGQR